MECKNCKLQLDEGITLCPGCGTDNTPVPEEIPAPVPENASETVPENAPETVPETVPETDGTESAAPEKKSGIVVTPGKLVLIIVSAVLLTALVVALVLQGMGVNFGEPAPTENPEALQEQVQASGDPAQVTCKASYTVSDEEVADNMSVVVATTGEAELTNAELQIYYWLQVQNFLSQYGSYAMYFGLDYTQPLDTQMCGLDDSGKTWQQYFLSAALADWHNYASLAEESRANGFQLDEQYSTMIENLPQSLATDAALQGFESAEKYLAYNVGAGATIADYQTYMRNYYQGFMYFQSRYEAMVPSEEELENYFAEHEADYAAQGLTRETAYVNVRHILVLPEGATVDTIYTETFPEEAWAVGEANAQEILGKYEQGEMTEEAFAALANEFSADPGSNTNGGLYEDVNEGMMVEAFDAWCFDPARQAGDYGIVRTELGFHIMYFSGSRTIWQEQVTSDMLNERGMALITETTEKYPMTVDYSKIRLGYVNIGA